MELYQELIDMIVVKRWDGLAVTEMGSKSLLMELNNETGVGADKEILKYTKLLALRYCWLQKLLKLAIWRRQQREMLVQNHRDSGKNGTKAIIVEPIL